MGKGSALGLIGSLASSGGGGKGGGGSGLTAEQQAALQFGQQQEDMRLTNFYADAGIPNSSGLAYDIGSTGLQAAAAGAGLAQQNQNQLASQLGQLGTALGGQSNTNPDTSNLNTGGSLSSQTV